MTKKLLLKLNLFTQTKNSFKLDSHPRLQKDGSWEF